MAGVSSYSTKGCLGSFLQERRRAMEGCRFKPENYNEISRVLGNGYAPDLNRVTSKYRADAASGYLRRLRRDVERSQGGYYSQLQTLPLQIKRLAVRKEDPRSFKSLLIPKLKLSPLPVVDGSTPSPRTTKGSPSPKMESPPAGGGKVPPLVVLKDFSYVPLKYFSPHSHTHIHVLFKQIPGQTSHKKGGASSVVSSEVSGSGGGGGGRSSSSSSGIFTDSSSKAAFRSMQHSLKNNSKLPSPREAPSSSSLQDAGEEAAGDSGGAWPAAGDPHLPCHLPMFHANFSPTPTHFKKRVAPVASAAAAAGAADKTSARAAAERSPRGTAAHHNSNSNNSGRSVFRSPRGGVAEHRPGGQARKSGDSSR